MSDIEKIENVLIDLQREVLAGVHLGASADIVAQIIPYWDKMMAIIRTSCQKVIDDAE